MKDQEESIKKQQIVEKDLQANSKTRLSSLDYFCLLAFPLVAALYWMFG